MVKCVIVGCKSSCRTDPDVKFFKFPSSKNPVYEKWMKICHFSEDIIRLHPMPYICSKHFYSESGPVNKLTKDCVPSLHLNPTHGLVNKVNAIVIAQQKKTRLISLVDEAVLEWSLRAHHYTATASVCTLRSGLEPIARRVVNMLDPTLEINFDENWWKKFRTNQISKLEACDINDSSNKTLNLAKIIKELNPYAIISNKGENIESVDENEIELSEKKNSESEEGSECNVKSEETSQNDETHENTNSEANVEPGLIINSYTDALEHIKTLENFALQQEDYRAIGMLSSLKYILEKRAGLH